MDRAVFPAIYLGPNYGGGNEGKRGFPGGTEVKNLPAVQKNCRKHSFDPWVGQIPWRRKWQPTPVFLPVKFHEQRSLVGYSSWDRKELDTTKQLNNSNNILKGSKTALWVPEHRLYIQRMQCGPTDF